MVDRYICYNVKDVKFLLKKYKYDGDIYNSKEILAKNKKISIFIKNDSYVGYCSNLCETCIEECDLSNHNDFTKYKIFNSRKNKLKRIIND